MNNKNIFLLIALSSLFFASCKKDNSCSTHLTCKINGISWSPGYITAERTGNDVSIYGQIDPASLGVYREFIRLSFKLNTNSGSVNENSFGAKLEYYRPQELTPYVCSPFRINYSVSGNNIDGSFTGEYFSYSITEGSFCLTMN